jgi:ABC-type nitrate/sulfonate/bicarbonate transport system substrate-binding protein
MRMVRFGRALPPWLRRAWPVLAALLGLAWLLGTHGHAVAGRPLVFAVAHLPLSLPVYVAEARGFFAAEGAVVNVADCQIGRRCLDRMLEGGADLATVAVLPLVRASLQGRGFGIVATMAAARNDAKIITRRGGADSAAALAGRRVGTFVGTSAHFLLDLSLLSAGVDPARVTTVALEPEDAAEALQSGRVDAVSLFEPYAWRTVRSLGADAQVLSDRRQHVESWMLVASAALDRSRDPDLAAVCRALVRAVRFIETEPAQAQLILQRRLALDAAALAWVLPDVDYRVELRQSLLHGLEEQARWALRSGQSQGPMPNFLTHLRPAPLASVLPRAVTVVMP